MIFIHMIDNYFIEPYIVGSKVNLSALSTIVIIVCGGLIWGIPGTILFIPFLAIVKIICDHVETLYDIDILYRDYARQKGIRLYRTASLNDSPEFIDLLQSLVTG